MATCKHAKVTAPGLDNVFADDLKLLPLSAFHRLATLLNSIEQGAPWPNSTKHAKASFLCKNPTKHMTPDATECWPFCQSFGADGRQHD